MSSKFSDLLPFITHTEKEHLTPSFLTTLKKYIYHWPLFLIGLAIAFFLAYLYTQIRTPLYNVKASVIIKDDKKSTDPKQQLQELVMLSPSKLAENELEVFQSRRMIAQVVKDLQLMVSFKHKNGLRQQELYKKSPIAIKFLSLSDDFDEQKFKIKIIDSNYFDLIDPDGGAERKKFNTVISNDFCDFKLFPTSNLFKYKGLIILVTINDANSAAEYYQDKIDAILPNKTAPVIELSLKDEVEQRGKDILNDLIRIYNTSTISEKNQTNQKALDFINSRIGSIQTGLDSSEKGVENYKSSEGLTDISSQSKLFLENVQTNDAKLNEVNVQLSVIDDIDKNINSFENIQSASASLGLSYPSLNSLIEKLSILQLQKDKLLATTPEKNPIFEPINNQIKSTKIEIKNNIKSIKTSLESAKDKLQTFNGGFESTIKDIPVQERHLVDKTRQLNIQQDLYVYLLQKREEVSLNYASTLPDARIVDDAYAEQLKSPATVTYGIAFLLGILLPIGFIFIRHNLNDRIIDSKEIEDVIDDKIFIELPVNDGTAYILNVADNNNFEIREQFRMLRTNVQLLNETQKKGWVTLVTSSISSEGKSFVSSNLAVVLAATGKKTIILEMDLRRPQVLKGFKLAEGKPGISDYLLEKSKIEQIIQPSIAHPNLDIIGCGQFSPDSSELLEKNGVDTLIDWLKLKYDNIIIDTPPINIVTDSLLLAKFSDLTLYVVRQNYTFKSLLPFIESLYKQAKFPNMKFVFNAVEKGARYGYGHKYDKGYYQVKTATPNKFIVRSALRGFLKRF